MNAETEPSLKVNVYVIEMIVHWVSYNFLYIFLLMSITRVKKFLSY